MNPINHVAIIMDGNGRWGLKNKNSRNAGHKAGIKTVEKIIKSSLERKIRFLTLYAFSTENWKRPEKEVNYLFNLLESFLNQRIDDFHKQNIKLKIIGTKKFSYKLNNLLKYAEKKDVLIVNAAGNSGANVDPGNKKTYITDEVDGKEIVSNFINVGAINNSFNKDQVASFSNFGSVNVDVFAPGSNIWSSVPQEKYDFYSGTSMAAPNTSGVAAAIRSFFPKLKAHQVKSVLMNSGVPLYPTLKNPKTGELVNPKSLSVSGKAVNLYNALIYCSNKSYKK